MRSEFWRPEISRLLSSGSTVPYSLVDTHTRVEGTCFLHLQNIWRHIPDYREIPVPCLVLAPYHGHNCSTWQVGDTIIPTTRVELLEFRRQLSEQCPIEAVWLHERHEAHNTEWCTEVALLNNLTVNSFSYHSVSDTTFVTEKANILWLKVPRQYPLVLLVRVFRRQGIAECSNKRGIFSAACSNSPLPSSTSSSSSFSS